MAFEPGNQLWKLGEPGRKRIFETPEQVWEQCKGYFQWIEDNPLREDKLFCHQGTIVRDSVNKMRAMTIAGLCLYLDIDETTWRDYRANPVFSPICARVERVIYEQKFSGAAADLFNANIIARDLGLKDETRTEHAGAIKVTAVDLTDDQLAAIASGTSI